MFPAAFPRFRPFRAPQESLHTQAAFSLVELSIVLVILGLLAGGILGGQSLIKAAELRSIGKEYEQWMTATYTFKNKYMALPGDFTKAASVWNESWNGDGNGNIDFPLAVGQHGEIFTFWQQLALAGLINGDFTGICGPTSLEDSIIGENVPGSRYSGGGWSVYWISPTTDITAEWFDLDYDNVYEFGASFVGYDTGAPILKPEEAWNLDMKFDDGKPGKGAMVVRFWDDCTDASSTTDYDADYALSTDSVVCTLGFRKVF